MNTKGVGVNISRVDYGNTILMLLQYLPPIALGKWYTTRDIYDIVNRGNNLSIVPSEVN